MTWNGHTAINGLYRLNVSNEFGNDTLTFQVNTGALIGSAGLNTPVIVPLGDGVTKQTTETRESPTMNQVH